MSDPISVPPIIEEKHSSWRGLWGWSVKLHYTFGVLGVGAAALSAALDGPPARILAVTAAVSTAVLGFVQPDKNYRKYVRAWRVIDMAIIKYQLGRGTVDDLIKAADDGERLITEFEAAAPPPATPLGDANTQLDRRD